VCEYEGINEKAAITAASTLPDQQSWCLVGGKRDNNAGEIGLLIHGQSQQSATNGRGFTNYSDQPTIDQR
jgi:hypothetical protein